MKKVRRAGRSGVDVDRVDDATVFGQRGHRRARRRVGGRGCGGGDGRDRHDEPSNIPLIQFYYRRLPGQAVGAASAAAYAYHKRCYVNFTQIHERVKTTKICFVRI